MIDEKLQFPINKKLLFLEFITKITNMELAILIHELRIYPQDINYLKQAQAELKRRVKDDTKTHT